MRSMRPAPRALRKAPRRVEAPKASDDLAALEGDALALATLQAVCRQAEAPASARAQAARTLLEASGALKGAETRAQVPAAEMTAQELDTALVSLANKDTASGA